jgi:hypothetical protein
MPYLLVNAAAPLCGRGVEHHPIAAAAEAEQGMTSSRDSPIGYK